MLWVELLIFLVFLSFFFLRLDKTCSLISYACAPKLSFWMFMWAAGGLSAFEAYRGFASCSRSSEHLQEVFSWLLTLQPVHTHAGVPSWLTVFSMQIKICSAPRLVLSSLLGSLRHSPVQICFSENENFFKSLCKIFETYYFARSALNPSCSLKSLPSV